MIKSMSKYEKVILVCVCVLCIGILINSTYKEQKLNLPLENVVQIKVISTEINRYTGKPVKRQGTGVFIEDNLILTVGHIVDKIESMEIFTVNGVKYNVVDWYKESEVDIGFIVVDTNDVEKKLKFDNAKLGEDVWTFGNPYRVFPVLTKGIISATIASNSHDNTKNMIITDAAANAGNSGSPLFDKQGNILGIMSWHYTYPATEGMNYFVRAEVIKLSLEKYKVTRALEEIE